MNELRKVIAGLECCNTRECGICPYLKVRRARCLDALLRDTLKILREVVEDGLY